MSATPIRVGLVEDHEDVLQLLQMQFSARGFEVIGQWTDATQCWNDPIWDEDRLPDVMCIDFNIGKVTGAELIEWIRTNYEDAVKIILFTAYVLDAGLPVMDQIDALVEKTSLTTLTEVVKQVHHNG